MASRTVRVRGIRGSIPGGYILGRSDKGQGDVQLISLTDVAHQLAATGTVGGGAAPVSVVAGSGISVSVSGSAYTVTNTGVRSAVAGTGISVSAATGAVTFSMADMAAHRFKGNNTGSTGAPLDLTATQLTAELNAMVGDSGSGGTKGLVPAPATGDASKFLGGDGAYHTVTTSAAISTLTDVTLTSLADKQFLRYDSGSSKWKNVSDISAATHTSYPASESGIVNLRTLYSTNIKVTAALATAAALPTCTYSNGSSGVGATLTASSNGTLTIDGTAVDTTTGAILVKDQASTFQNGLYSCTTKGDASHAFVLTRLTSYDESDATSGYLSQEISTGNLVPVTGGTNNATSVWMLTTSGTNGQGSFIIGTDGLTFTKLFGAASATPNTFDGRPTNPATTTSTSLVMMGIGSTCAFTPTSTGKVLLILTGQIANTGNTLTGQVQYGTGTAPANGAALTGTQATRLMGTNTSPGTGFPFCQAAVVSLTARTAYWFDIALNTSAAATSSGAFNLEFTAIEIPAASAGGTGSAITYSLTSPANNDLVRFDSASGTWKNTTLSAEIDSAIGSTRGSLLERGASGWALLTPGTSGLFLKSAGAGADPLYATIAGAAGGFGLYSQSITAAPTNASIGFTTWLNQGGASFADNVAGMTITAPAASANDTFRIRYKTAPSTPYTITALVAISYGAGTNNGDTTFGWTDGTKWQGCRLTLAAGQPELLVCSFTNATTFSAIVSDTIKWNTTAWIRIANDGTNITFSISSDGVNFSVMYTVAKASGFLGSTGYSNIMFGAAGNSKTCYGTIMSYVEA